MGRVLGLNDLTTFSGVVAAFFSFLFFSFLSSDVIRTCMS